jgi:hypothetical protein
LSKPLWQFHLIGPYGTGCALVGRVHHCLADGPALMHVLLALTDAAPNAPPRVTPAQALPASPEPARGTAVQLTELLVQQGFNILLNPGNCKRQGTTVGENTSHEGLAALPGRVIMGLHCPSQGQSG